MSGVAALQVSKTLRIGSAGTGSFTQNGGTVAADVIVLGYNRDSYGNYTLESGTVSTTRYLYVGDIGEGYFSQDGGTLNVGTGLSIGVFPGSFC